MSVIESLLIVGQEYVLTVAAAERYGWRRRVVCVEADATGGTFEIVGDPRRTRWVFVASDLRRADSSEDAREGREAIRVAMERGRVQRPGRLALLEILSWIDRCLQLAWDPTPDDLNSASTLAQAPVTKKIEMRLVVEVASDQSIESAIADARSVLIDALGEFRSARGGDLTFPVLGIESYVAKRYDGQSPKFRAQKVAEVLRRCLAARAMQRAVFDCCEISERIEP